MFSQACVILSTGDLLTNLLSGGGGLIPELPSERGVKSDGVGVWSEEGMGVWSRGRGMSGLTGACGCLVRGVRTRSEMATAAVSTRPTGMHSCI